MAGEGLVLNEPSVVAVEEGSGRILSGGCAVGHLARQMLGRTPQSISVVKPLAEGVIADFELCEAMLRYFLRKAQRRSWRPRPRVLVGRSRLRHAGGKAGGVQQRRPGRRRVVYVISEAKASAIGAGLPIAEPIASMICDIGGGTTDVAILSLGEIVASQSIRVAGDAMDRAVVDYLKRNYSLRVGLPAAEALRIEIGSAYPLEEELVEEVRGVDAVTGLPRKAILTSEEIREALAAPLEAILDAIRQTLDECRPDLAADLVDNGLVLAGGGALLRGLERFIEERTGIPTRVAADPLTTCARGTLICLEHLDKLAQRARIERRRRVSSGLNQRCQAATTTAWLDPNRNSIGTSWSPQQAARPSVAGTRSRLRWLLSLVALAAAAIVLLRAAQLEWTDGAGFRAEATRPIERAQLVPAPRGRILARDGSVLAADTRVQAVAVHYRWLEEPADPAWLRGRPALRLTRVERRDKARVAAAEAAMLAERAQLHERLARLCGLPLDDWHAAGQPVEQRIAALAEHVNQRRLERFLAMAASRPSRRQAAATWLDEAGAALAEMLAPETNRSAGCRSCWPNRKNFIRCSKTCRRKSRPKSPPIRIDYPGTKIVELPERDYPAGVAGRARRRPVGIGRRDGKPRRRFGPARSAIAGRPHRNRAAGRCRAARPARPRRAKDRSSRPGDGTRTSPPARTGPRRRRCRSIRCCSVPPKRCWTTPASTPRQRRTARGSGGAW